MIISRNSLFYRFYRGITGNRPPEDICALTRNTLVILFIVAFFGSLLIVCIWVLFQMTGSFIGELIGSIAYGFDDNGVGLTLLGCLAFYLWGLIIQAYCLVKYDFSPLGVLMEKIKPSEKVKAENQQNLFIAMVKSFFGKFCVRIEYR